MPAGRAKLLLSRHRLPVWANAVESLRDSHRTSLDKSNIVCGERLSRSFALPAQLDAPQKSLMGFVSFPRQFNPIMRVY